MTDGMLRPVGETRHEGPLVSLRFHPALPLLSALDPTHDQAEGERFESFVSDQGATLLRFARAAEGSGHRGLETFDTSLMVNLGPASEGTDKARVHPFSRLSLSHVQRRLARDVS